MSFSLLSSLRTCQNSSSLWIICLHNNTTVWTYSVFYKRNVLVLTLASTCCCHFAYVLYSQWKYERRLSSKMPTVCAELGKILTCLLLRLISRTGRFDCMRYNLWLLVPLKVWPCGTLLVGIYLFVYLFILLQCYFLQQAGFDRPLLMPKTEEVEMLTKQREDTLIARMKMFVHLRQDLERVCSPWLCCLLLLNPLSSKRHYQSCDDCLE